MDEEFIPRGDLRATLEAAGFQVRTERHSWWRCLIEEPGASWVGEGSTEEGAIVAAFTRMVPSAHARTWLIARSIAPAAAAATPPHESEPAALVTPAAEPIAPRVADPDPEPSVEARDGSGAPAPTRPRAPAPIPLEDALGMLAQQSDDIQVASRELGELAPRRLRLLMLHWITRARSVQDLRPGDRDVFEAVHRIANQIQEQAFRLWPGSIPALQLSARPAECRLVLFPDGDAPPLRSWAEVAEAAQAALEAIEEDRALDGDGWADAAVLHPRPNDPDGALREVRGRLAKLAVDWEPPKRVPPPGALRTDAAARHGLTGIAQRARWLRGDVSDVAAWSDLIGHLRRIAQFHEYDFPELGRILHEDYCPSATWAKELGQDPERKQRRKLRRALLQRRPRGAEVSTPDLKCWMLEAFEVFDNPDLAVWLREYAPRLGDFAIEEIGDRRIRGRFKKLLERLAAPRDAQHEESLVQEAADADRAEPPNGEPAVVAAPDPQQVLLEKVRSRTRGRRLLFVSNRADPHLEAHLREGLEPVRLDWCIAEDRLIASAAERIACGTYHIVLCATGFISHKTEKSLREGCLRGRVPYVRVFKGRLVSCLRALERDLGM